MAHIGVSEKWLGVEFGPAMGPIVMKRDDLVRLFDRFGQVAQVLGGESIVQDYCQGIFKIVDTGDTPMVQLPERHHQALCRAIVDFLRELNSPTTTKGIGGERDYPIEPEPLVLLFDDVKDIAIALGLQSEIPNEQEGVLGIFSYKGDNDDRKRKIEALSPNERDALLLAISAFRSACKE